MAGAGGGPPPPFATSCATATRDTIITTTSTTTYVNALSLPLGVVAAGDYWLGLFVYYSQDSVFEGDAQLQLTQNGSEIANNRGHSNGTGIAAQSGKNLFANTRILTVTAGFLSFGLNFRVGSPSGIGDEAAIFWARLEWWSFN
ncbi:MAG: hypothetical protein OEZ01_00560 [Candidatus Heimdallarchaeota archaeon]|nr:hypothetical protein [Candidatus Heimdallarchaeota archaeon]MDH5676614.1 hypothetical protein [Myxococcales bacterium]